MPKRIIAGIDEVGRGPLAGPVVAACVHIPDSSHEWLTVVTDSKKLSKAKRDYLAPLIRQHCIWSIAEIPPKDIDDINILQATFRAMEKCAHDMPLSPDFIYIDGNKIPPNLQYEAEAIIKGDSKIKEIACASIIAKVHRDTIMEHLGNKFPEYGWESNSGYGTKKHLDAIQKYGVTTHHRQSFAPVRAQLRSVA
jgi:ribonuclease HII